MKNKNKTLIIASKNLGKIKEFQKLLINFPLNILPQPDGINIKETGRTFIENARLKASEVSTLTGEWSLSDDSGLSVKALCGAPGIFSSRYANSDSARILRLLKELENTDDRRAYFSSALCIAAPKGKILCEVEARCHGVIASEPRGDQGFGYDPIFEVIPIKKTFAEMEPKEKQNLSHRAKAFALLRPHLKKLIEENN